MASAVRAVTRLEEEGDEEEEKLVEALALAVAPAVVRACIQRLEIEIETLEPHRQSAEEGLRTAIWILRSLRLPER